MFTSTDRFLIIDTETTNSIDDPIVYDIGFAVIDTKGKVYESGSYVIKETFLNEELMSTAFFKDKIPMYYKDMISGNRIIASFFEVMQAIRAIMYQYHINTVLAHNAQFDYRALNTTLRYLTKSAIRFFFPFKTIFWDTLKMARLVLPFEPQYIYFCKKNGFLTSKKKIRFTAEIIYRYLINDTSFVESHTAFEDVTIEKEIFSYLIQNYPEVNGRLWENISPAPKK